VIDIRHHLLGTRHTSLVTRHLFCSLHGISHNKIEDTKEKHLEMTVTAFDKLADKAMSLIQLTVDRTM
jgi:L-cystine uptake protein TcyP (sodium:dicarboxylate symporter family)